MYDASSYNRNSIRQLMTRKSNLNITWRRSSFSSHRQLMQCNYLRLALSCPKSPQISQLMTIHQVEVRNVKISSGHKALNLATAELCRNSKVVWERIAPWLLDYIASNLRIKRIHIRKLAMIPQIWVQMVDLKILWTLLARTTRFSLTAAVSTPASTWTKSC